ncbi:hypothetical protein LPJ53_006279, partial [Coemansia erecta]
LHYDVVFMPAYKSIPWTEFTIIALVAQESGCNVAYSFNRTDNKDHGEGGSI